MQVSALFPGLFAVGCGSSAIQHQQGLPLSSFSTKLRQLEVVLPLLLLENAISNTEACLK